MGNMNQEPAVLRSPKPLWMRAIILFCAAAGSALFAVAFYPPMFDAVRSMLAQPISNALAADHDASPSPAQARQHRITDAKTAVHGMFVKDPYGCVYMFQYVSAQLSLVPVLDEHKQALCNR